MYVEQDGQCRTKANSEVPTDEDAAGPSFDWFPTLSNFIVDPMYASESWRLNCSENREDGALAAAADDLHQVPTLQNP